MMVIQTHTYWDKYSQEFYIMTLAFSWWTPRVSDTKEKVGGLIPATLIGKRILSFVWYGYKLEYNHFIVSDLAISVWRMEWLSIMSTG